MLGGRDAVGVMPTGAGKSLCFQIPALFLPKLTVVVSPLIALMQDQTAKLADAHIEAARFDSTLSASEHSDAVKRVTGGEARIVIATPERMSDDDFVSMLMSRGVSLFVVDEAHCISQWGHDFRPAYLSLAEALTKLGRPPTLALTATAPANVLEDIRSQLRLRDPLIVNGGIDRENLFLECRATPSDDAKLKALDELLATVEGTGIIYAATVKACNELYEKLSAAGHSVDRYHGRMPAKQRKEVYERFMANQARIVVATNAFGLGIDKADVRFVVHWQFPESLETYYQEAGRAGRDGSAARATLLYRIEDRRIQSYFLGGKYPRRDEARAVYDPITDAPISVAELRQKLQLSEKRVRVLLAQLSGAEIVKRGRGGYKRIRNLDTAEAFEAYLSAYESRHTTDRERLAAMTDYAESGRCRWQTLRAYFGTGETSYCKQCDNCHRRYDAPAPTDVTHRVA